MTIDELYEKAKSLPLLPGVYIIRNKADEIIYIGKAKRLRTRVSQYFRQGVPHDAKVSKMIQNAFAFDVIVTHTELEALVLECSQIKQHQPKYNILLKDDKGYAYVKITKEPWQRISACLQKNDDDAQYLGPYTSSFAVREMVDTAALAFRLPSCTRKFPQDIGKGRPCLNAHIGRCMAVCSGKISHAQYIEATDGAIHMIKRGYADIVKLLKAKMQDAAERLDFERAAIYRNQITAIEKANTSQKVVSQEAKNEDIIAFAKSTHAAAAAVLRFRDGRLTDKKEFIFKDILNLEELREEFIKSYYLQQEDLPKIIAVDDIFDSQTQLSQLLTQQKGSIVKIYVPQKGDTAKLVQMAYLNAVERLARESGRFAKEQRVLDELAQLLGLQKPPEIIESYDISNWGEGTSVAGMVVFENGKPKKAGYRRFKMETVFQNDDYASMAETLARRAAQLENNGVGQFGIKPDLILLDGGKGQVSAVKAVIKNTALADVPIFGMVKDNKHRTRAIVDSDGEIAISMHRGVFTFITSIQDEVHRFAISYQRQGQKAKSYSSTLENVQGVGKVTSKALMAHFKTATNVKNASVNELMAVKGVNLHTAQAIFAYFDTAVDKKIKNDDNI